MTAAFRIVAVAAIGAALGAALASPAWAGPRFVRHGVGPFGGRGPVSGPNVPEPPDDPSNPAITILATGRSLGSIGPALGGGLAALAAAPEDVVHIAGWGQNGGCPKPPAASDLVLGAASCQCSVKATCHTTDHSPTLPPFTACMAKSSCITGTDGLDIVGGHALPGLIELDLAIAYDTLGKAAPTADPWLYLGIVDDAGNKLVHQWTQVPDPHGVGTLTHDEKTSFFGPGTFGIQITFATDEAAHALHSGTSPIISPLPAEGTFYDGETENWILTIDAAGEVTLSAIVESQMEMRGTWLFPSGPSEQTGSHD